MRPRRSQLLLLVFVIGLAASCDALFYEAEPVASVTEEEHLSRLADDVVSGDGFVFGAPDEKGLAIGIAVENPELRVGERLRYRVAVRNTTQQQKNRVLWTNFEDLVTPTRESRTRLAIREPGGLFSSVGTAVGYSDLQGTTPFSLDMRLEPSQTRARRGNSQGLSYEGEFEVAILFGGPAFRFSSQSGVVRVRVSK